MNWAEENNRIANLAYRLPEKLRALLDGFKGAVHEKNTSCVIIIDGRSGLGKSTLANQIGLYCDANYNLNKIHYTPDQFLNGEGGKTGLAQAVKGDYILFDEAMLISNRSALSQVNKMIVQAMSMIRSKNLFVVFCVNSIFDLDKNLALSRADLLLHVYGQSLTDRGRFCAFFKGSDGMDRLKILYLMGKKFYDYGKPRSNFNARFPKAFIVDEVEYERQKQEGINRFLHGQTSASRFEANAVRARNKLIFWMKQNTQLSIKEIAAIADISEKLVDNALSAGRKGEL